VLLFFRLGSYPSTWYDEGLNTITANTFLTHRVYGTVTTRGVNPFDPAVTTGPTINIPVAFLFGLFGTGTFQARVIPALYALLAILLVYRQFEALNGGRAALFSTFVFLLMPPIASTGFLLLGRQVLGETASFAFILLGLWFWLKDFETPGLIWSLLAGTAFGLAGISKLQSSISLGTTIAILSLLRYFWTKSGRRLSSFIPPVLMIFLIVGWMTLQFTGYSQAFQLENQQANQEAIRLLLIPGFWQRSLSRSGILMLVGMLIALAMSVAQLMKVRDISIWSRREWTFAAFGLMTLFSSLWWSLFSIGWPRYAYFGWMSALFIISLQAWTAFRKIQDSNIFANERVRRFGYPLASAGLVLLTIGIHFPPILRAPVEDDAQRMAAYIREHVTEDDVIESWDWQVDALSGHPKFSHPPQLLLLLATQQRFLERAEFDLEYPLLGADPDYLLIGPFSSWTNIYGFHDVEAYFTEINTYGPYTLWGKKLD